LRRETTTECGEKWAIQSELKHEGDYMVPRGDIPLSGKSKGRTIAYSR